MTTNTEIKTLESALEKAYPTPDSPHTSIIMQSASDRVAFMRGWQARDAEITELRAAMVSTASELEEWRFTNRIDELQRENDRLRASQQGAGELPQDERYADCLATIRDLDSIGMEFAADLCKLPVVAASNKRNIDYLVRQDVMDLVVAWRGAWDKNSAQRMPIDRAAVAQRAASVPAEAVQNDDLPPLTMALYGTRELLEAERMRRQGVAPYAYDIRDTNGDGCLRLAKDVDPRRLIAVTVTPLYTAAPVPDASVRAIIAHDAVEIPLPEPASNWPGFPFPGTAYFTKPQLITLVRSVQFSATVPQDIGRDAALSDEQRAVIDEAAQVLESAASYNRSESRTILAHTQRDRADRLRAILAATPPANVAQAAPTVGKSLLRNAISTGNPLPAGCYCKPGMCAAPKIMGRQTPCRDPEKAAAPQTTEKP